MSSSAANDPQPLEPNQSNRNRAFQIEKVEIESDIARLNQAIAQAEAQIESLSETIMSAREEKVFLEARLDMLYETHGRGRLNNSVTNGVTFPLLGGRRRKNRKTRKNRR